MLQKMKTIFCPSVVAPVRPNMPESASGPISPAHGALSSKPTAAAVSRRYRRTDTRPLHRPCSNHAQNLRAVALSVAKLLKFEVRSNSNQWGEQIQYSLEPLVLDCAENTPQSRRVSIRSPISGCIIVT